MGKLIDFSDHCLRTFLPVLLQDHTTGKNIIWATDPPPELGVGFADEITLEQLADGRSEKDRTRHGHSMQNQRLESR